MTNFHPRAIGKIFIPMTSGLTDVRTFFPGLPVRADPEVEEFLKSVVSQYHAPELHGLIFANDPQGVDDEAMAHLMGGDPDPAHVCAVLQYLGAEGMKYLAIPAGEEEVNIILGYFRRDDGFHPLYVEHELEEGEPEQIHLHLRDPNTWGDDVPMLIVVT